MCYFSILLLPYVSTEQTLPESIPTVKFSLGSRYSSDEDQFETFSKCIKNQYEQDGIPNATQ